MSDKAPAKEEKVEKVEKLEAPEPTVYIGIGDPEYTSADRFRRPPPARKVPVKPSAKKANSTASKPDDSKSQ